MSIELNGVVKKYGEQLALNTVSFEAKKGEILGLLGPNGAGKSTSMKIISGYIPLDEGSVMVCGIDVSKDAQTVQQKIGYLPEHNPLYLDMYVREYLRFTASIHDLKDVKERIEEVIELTGLSKEASKVIRNLSKGYRQRVGIAQAILHDPEVLILDEPISGLDPNQLVEIRALIKSLSKEKTVILSTHIMQEVEAICDRIVVIDSGKIVADAAAKELVQSHSNIRVLVIETNQAIDLGKLSKKKFISDVEALGKNKYKLSSQSEEDVRELVFDFVVDQKLKLLSMQEETQNIESVFQKLTK